MTEPGPAHRIRVAFVGAGPGDPGLLTLRAVDALRAADLVLIDAPLDSVLLEHVREETAVRRLGESMRRPTHRAHPEEVLRHIRELPAGSADDRHVVRLVDGCPVTYHGIDDEIQACRDAGYDVDIVAGVSAFSAVPAYAGIALTKRRSSSVVIWCAAHGDDQITPALSPEVNVVVYGATDEVARGLHLMLEGGRDPLSHVVLIQKGTTTAQHTTFTELADAGTRLLDLAPDASTMAVVGDLADAGAVHDWFESKPLFGWEVLVPRTMDQAGPMVSQLAHYGAHASVVPTISVEPPRTPAQVEKAMKALVTGRYDWIGFTSTNAVRAVKEKLIEFGLDERALAGIKVAAVGAATAQALRDWGVEPDLMPTGEQSSLGLLQVWPEYDENVDPLGCVLLPRADIATDTLVAGLGELGWHVDDVTAYRTVRAAPPSAPVREAIKSGGFDAVVFTSSSTVRNLVGIAGKPHASTVIACIGPATAATAQEHGLTVHVIAERASGTALIDALAAYGVGLALQTEAGRRTPKPSESRPARRSRGRRSGTGT